MPLFKQFKDGGGTVKEPFPMYFIHAGAGHDAWMQAIANQIQTTLGFKVQASPRPRSSRVPRATPSSSARTLPPAPTDSAGASTTRRPTTSSTRCSRRAAPTTDPVLQPGVDALLKQARAEPDATKRVKIYQQAEDIVLEDLPIIPCGGAPRSGWRS